MAPDPFPLVEIRPVANAQNVWVALLLKSDGDAIENLFGTQDLLTAMAPLDCILLLDSTAILTPAALALLPPNRVALAVRAAALTDEEVAPRLAALQLAGYRVMLDGELPEGMAGPKALRTMARDGSQPPLAPASLPALFGPHLAHGVDSLEAFRACENAGFAWFAGDYMLDNSACEGTDGASRKRLLTLLALLACDADSRELEVQLKQDAVLSYHLLKLVNSAAFSCGTPITSFGQAISRIGRRQLQRWLQLLLYAHQQANGLPNPLLPLAALRGAALEALCKQGGGDRDQQDLAFMTGVFSLLDRLFHMPMTDIVRDLCLPKHVEAALLRREGPLGRRLALLEVGRTEPALLASAGVDGPSWWQALLHAYHWAIQVARNV
jgi:EAL and modified HD-GYP domain-containing signal transduction protein